MQACMSRQRYGYQTSVRLSATGQSLHSLRGGVRGGGEGCVCVCERE